ncbi:MAG: Maf family protein [Woeseiaceae bacterium]
MSAQPTLLLASSSPRRREILDALGLQFEVQETAVDERVLTGETPQQMVLRLAAAKASAPATRPGDFVIGADTAVVLDGSVLGKPVDRADAVDMLLRLSGRRHCVLTGVALRGPEGVRSALSRTEVSFREISRDEALAYWHSGEPGDKAGAYGIQGLGGMFVENVAGSYSGVVGLPVFETTELLRQAGFDLLTKHHADD